MMMRRLLSLLTVLALAMALATPGAEAAKPRRKTRPAPAATTTRTVDKVRSEQSAIQKSVSETATRIQATEKELDRKMEELNSLNADIATQTTAVTRLRADIDSIGTAIGATSDSIAMLDRELEGMRRTYAAAVAGLQTRGGNIDAINFIFSSSSFAEAWRRLRYLRRFSEWRREKVAVINATADRIAAHRGHLTTLRHSRDRARRQAEQQQHALQNKQEESRRMVASLRKEDSRLRRRLAEQRQRSAALDRELDRLIAEEQRRIAREEAERRRKEAEREAQERRRKEAGRTTPSTGTLKKNGASTTASSAGSKASATTSAASSSALTGSFESNKGKLLFPVNGFYKVVRRFGRQPHPTLPHVTIDNSGIDIETAAGATVRAVFAGTVSAIFHQDGYGTIVMLRHGSYVTVYAGLAGASVSKGQTVTAGQAIGTVAGLPSGRGGELHFEVRNERAKLNPSAWVR